MQFQEVDGTRWSYTTMDGDMVDLVAFNFYGKHGKTTEKVLDFNTGLAAKGPVLTAGVVIYLPKIAEESSTNDMISLWD